MMYQVLDGPCNESFGIHVAGTAGFPTSVLSAAKRKASALEFPSAFGKCVDSSVATTTSGTILFSYYLVYPHLDCIRVYYDS